MKKTTGEGGSVMVAVLVVIMIVGGLSGTMLMQAMGGQRSTSRTVEASKLLFVAEAGLDYNYVRMSDDPLYAVVNLAFQLDGTDQSYISPSLTLDAGASKQSFQFRVQYLLAGTPVVFADRADPVEVYDEIVATCTASSPISSRTVTSWYTPTGIGIIRGAITSDMNPTGTSGSGESLARKGHIVFDTDKNDDVVFGDMLVNGGIYFDSTSLTESNIDSYLNEHDGELLKNLDGTEDELPDFTEAGGDDQLFDFERFKAAAAAGAGQIYSSKSAFATAMNNANSVGDKLEGITVLEIDPATWGAEPTIGSGDIPGGIHITGTLVLLFADGTDPNYELDLSTRLNINAANLSGWSKYNEATYTTGYPGVFDDPTKKHSAVDISPAFENFLPSDDYPALMMNNAVLDLEEDANICGVVYSPNFMELDAEDDTQYFNGAIYTGGGFCSEGEDGVTAIRYDPNCVDRLQTKDGKGQALLRTGYAVLN